MKITILTLFPEMFVGPFNYSIIKRAQQNNLVDIEIVNIRDFGLGRHSVVDDRPYGGGKGMLLRVDVLERAINEIKEKNNSYGTQRIVLMDPDGSTFNQSKAKYYSNINHLILICGHYEGVDERIKAFIDEEISIGDFITTGGEIPAIIITDAVIRLVKDVLKDGVTDEESFSLMNNDEIKLEQPQYTRPEVFKEMHVPSILLSGNHKNIQNWKK